MANLATLAQAKAQLRVDWTEEDNHISLLLDAAESAVLDYIKRDYEWTSANVPKAVTLSILVMVSVFYDYYRNGAGVENNIANGYLPPAVTSLLHRYRSPALA